MRTHTSMFFDWRHRYSDGVNLVKGRYPSMADSNRAVARPNVFCSRFRRQNKRCALQDSHGLFWPLLCDSETLILAGFFNYFCFKTRVVIGV
jgi:hypothetical protein